MICEKFDLVRWHGRMEVTRHSVPGKFVVEEVDFVQRLLLLDDGDIIIPAEIEQVIDGGLIYE